jgi:hypothetical protein
MGSHTPEIVLIALSFRIGVEKKARDRWVAGLVGPTTTLTTSL